MSGRKKELLSKTEHSMSVEDFRRLVHELYLEPEVPPAGERFQAGTSAHNVAILVDTSGSMERNDPQLLGLKDSLACFAAQLAAYAARGICLNVCLIGFSEKITAFFTADNFTEFAFRSDDPFYRAIHKLRGRGGANYQAAFHKAGAWLAEHGGAQSTSAVFFITDGGPTRYYHDAFVHSVAAAKSGIYVCNGREFSYGGKGRIYYDAHGRAVNSNSGARRYRVSEDSPFEVRVGSSLNWFEARATFEPDRPARRVRCALPQYYVPGQPHYFDASGNALPNTGGAAYRVSASGNFEQYRKGAWHTPAGAVAATTLDDGGVTHSSLTTRVQGGNGIHSGPLEIGKSLRACREIAEKSWQRLSLYAIGIGGAVDASMLNSLDSAGDAKILLDIGQMATVLAAVAHSDFSSVFPDLRTEYPPDMFHAQDGDMEFDSLLQDIAPEDAPFYHGMPDESGEHAASFHADGGLLATLGGDLLGDDAELIIDGVSFPTAPVEQNNTAVVRHFSLTDEHLGLRDMFGEDATVDYLLSRVTASQETRTVNGETVEDLVLRVHGEDNSVTPVETIVLEGFAQLHLDISDDLHSLLQHLLHT